MVYLEFVSTILGIFMVDERVCFNATFQFDSRNFAVGSWVTLWKKWRIVRVLSWMNYAEIYDKISQILN